VRQRSLVLGLVFGGNAYLAAVGGGTGVPSIAESASADQARAESTQSTGATRAKRPDGKPDRLALSRAKALFQKYVELEAAFDPAQADLLHPSARIHTRRTTRTGEVRHLSATPAELKVVLKHVMPIAKARNDRNEYSNVTYWAEGERVRIRATRYSLLKKVESPVTLLVGPDSSGVWWIYEDSSESGP
jgi:hypothetical protein